MNELFYLKWYEFYFLLLNDFVHINTDYVYCEYDHITFNIL